jgi:hypothetical protein
VRAANLRDRLVSAVVLHDVPYLSQRMLLCRMRWKLHRLVLVNEDLIADAEAARTAAPDPFPRCS